MREEWGQIFGHEGHYEVSNLGRVRSLPRIVLRTDGVAARLRGKVLHNSLAKNGYEVVSLYVNLAVKKHYVHAVVATAFCDRPDSAEVVRHLNGDCLDNRAVNLAWGTHTENAADMLAHGTNFQASKSLCKYGHQLAIPNLTASMLKRGHRQCLACNRAHSAVRWTGRPKDDFQAISDSYYADIMKAAA